MRRRKGKDQKRWLRLRLMMVGWCFVAAFGLLLGRGFQLHLWQREALRQRAQSEFMRRVEVAPRRGVIYDRNQIELAVSLDTDSVYARPLEITNSRSAGRRLARALGLPQSKVVKKLRSEKGFVWLARRVNPAKARAVRRLNLWGVGLVKEPRRFYPFKSLASHVLGFAGLDARGLEGVERHYDHTLRGQATTVTQVRDALGRTLHLTSDAFSALPEGHNIFLTLDKDLQYQVEKILTATVTRYRARGGQAVVMIPQTGEILAMASLPTFNPNVFGRFPKSTFRNRVVTDTFEPGSTFKAFTAAAALASHKVTLEQRFYCEAGLWQVGGRLIRDTKPHGSLNLAEIVQKSSNIGMAKVAQEVGAANLYRIYRAFGFGQRTGVDLPGEVAGTLRPYRRWRTIEMANISFGQGVAVTSLQMVAAMGAVANHGVLMRPYVVRAVVDRQGRLVQENGPQVMRRVISARQARLLTAMLAQVVRPGGTGVPAALKAFAVAGKTGTAQKPLPSGGYSKHDYIASFLGFVPYDDPQVVVLVMIDEPRGAHYGGVVAGPAFARIAAAALARLGVRAPTLVAGRPQPVYQQPLHLPQPQVAALLARRALAAGKTPDLRGVTLRQVIKLTNGRALRLQVRGWGRVVVQDPRAGSPLGHGLRLRLAPAGGGA